MNKSYMDYGWSWLPWLTGKLPEGEGFVRKRVGLGDIPPWDLPKDWNSWCLAQPSGDVMRS